MKPHEQGCTVQERALKGKAQERTCFFTSKKPLYLHGSALEIEAQRSSSQLMQMNIFLAFGC